MRRAYWRRIQNLVKHHECFSESFTNIFKIAISVIHQFTVISGWLILINTA